MRIINLITALIVTVSCFPVYSDELPFGSVDLDLYGGDLSEQLHVLHDSLGFNIFWTYDNDSYNDIDEFADSGITVIRQGGESDSIHVLSYLNYAKIQAEEHDNKIKMYDCGGDFIGDYWVSDSGSVDTLFGPNGFNPPCWTFEGSPNKYYIKMERYYLSSSIYPAENDSVIDYYVGLNIKIESGAGTEDTVAYLKAVFEDWDCIAQDTVLLMTITGSDFNTNDSLTILTTPTYFNMPDTVLCHDGDTLFLDNASARTGAAFIVETTGKRKVSVDWLKIYDLRGWDLVETDEYVDELRRNADEFDDLGDDMWGWYLRDEPCFPNIQPMGVIQDTIRDEEYGNPNWNVMTCLNYKQHYDWWCNNVNSDVVTPDIYPFIYSGTDSTSYTGYSATNKHMYMQSRLNDQIEEHQWAKQAADSSGKEYWAVLQSFNQAPPDGFWRKPTPSEMLVQTYLAVAQGARGIIYWKYGVSSSRYLYGLDSLGTHRETWYAIRDDINPYIKAIDSVYLGLEWDTAYTVDPGSAFPSGSSGFIDDITAVTNPDSLGGENPDLGWFQVGEYHDDAGKKYFMLVNRACNDTSGAEAPSVTAIVKLRRSAFNNASSLYVIDIAHDVDTNYQAISETTYTTLYDGSLYFTTVLKAGEGRLFKIANV